MRRRLIALLNTTLLQLYSIELTEKFNLKVFCFGKDWLNVILVKSYFVNSPSKISNYHDQAKLIVEPSAQKLKELIIIS